MSRRRLAVRAETSYGTVRRFSPAVPRFCGTRVWAIGTMVPERMRRIVSPASALAHASRSSRRLAER